VTDAASAPVPAARTSPASDRGAALPAPSSAPLRGDAVARPLRVYIAGCLERAAEACDRAADLRLAGVEVVSRWHDTRPDRAAEETLPVRSRADIAAANYGDIRRADAVLWLADARSRGALVEVGIAVGRGLPVFAAGDPATVTLMALVPGVVWTERASVAVGSLATLRPAPEAL